MKLSSVFRKGQDVMTSFLVSMFQVTDDDDDILINNDDPPVRLHHHIRDVLGLPLRQDRPLRRPLHRPRLLQLYGIP